MQVLMSICCDSRRMVELAVGCHHITCRYDPLKLVKDDWLLVAQH